MIHKFFCLEGEQQDIGLSRMVDAVIRTLYFSGVLFSNMAPACIKALRLGMLI